MCGKHSAIMNNQQLVKAAAFWGHEPFFRCMNVLGDESISTDDLGNEVLSIYVALWNRYQLSMIITPKLLLCFTS